MATKLGRNGNPGSGWKEWRQEAETNSAPNTSPTPPELFSFVAVYNAWLAPLARSVRREGSESGREAGLLAASCFAPDRACPAFPVVGDRELPRLTAFRPGTHTRPDGWLARSKAAHAPPATSTSNLTRFEVIGHDLAPPIPSIDTHTATPPPPGRNPQQTNAPLSTPSFFPTPTPHQTLNGVLVAHDGPAPPHDRRRVRPCPPAPLVDAAPPGRRRPRPRRPLRPAERLAVRRRARQVPGRGLGEDLDLGLPRQLGARGRGVLLQARHEHTNLGSRGGAETARGRGHPGGEGVRTSIYKPSVPSTADVKPFCYATHSIFPAHDPSRRTKKESGGNLVSG